MDPDMVRQQEEEEEAAARLRLLQTKPQPEPPSLLHLSRQADAEVIPPPLPPKEEHLPLFAEVVDLRPDTPPVLAQSKPRPEPRLDAPPPEVVVDVTPPVLTEALAATPIEVPASIRAQVKPEPDKIDAQAPASIWAEVKPEPGKIDAQAPAASMPEAEPEAEAVTPPSPPLIEAPAAQFAEEQAPPSPPATQPEPALQAEEEPAAEAITSPPPLIDEHITLYAEVRDSRHDAPPPPGRAFSTARAWIAALYCTVLTGAGLAGGLMVGVKLALVPSQTLAFALLTGYALGWVGTAGWLMRHGVPRGRAYRAPFLAAALVVIVEMMAKLMADHFSAAPPTGYPEDAVALYALIIGAGAVVAFGVALSKIRKVMARH